MVRILVHKFVTLSKMVSVLLVGGTTVLICYALIPFVKIRFGHLYTSRVGHLCYNMDNYLAGRRERNSDEWGVFRTDKHISNKMILSSWSKEKNILFTKFAYFPFHFLSKLMPHSRLLISWKSELHPEFSVVSATRIIFTLRKSDEISGSELLNELGITGQFICIHNRDSAYLEHYHSDGNVHDYRDFEFDDFKCTIEKITKQNISAVRLGEIVKKESDISNPMFIDLTGSKR
ncbi:MAG: TIGR04372 family glycosyltransferase, partial [Methylophilaceae bacterium]